MATRTRNPLGRLPKFANDSDPEPDGPAPAAPDPDPDPRGTPDPGPDPGPRGTPGPDPGPETSPPFRMPVTEDLVSRLRERARERLTGTSTAGEPGIDPETATRLMAVVIGAATLVIAGTVRARGRKLRRPTPVERDEIARPLGRILARWVPMPFGRDVADLAEAGAALNEYLAAGPLLDPHPAVDPGVPADLQEVPHAA